MACGLWIKDVEADGACLFRAFADQLSGNPEEHAAFREGCVDFMEANRGDFEPFLEEEFEQYCAQMRQSTTWGGHVEVQALARCHGVNAIIYRPSEARGPRGHGGGEPDGRRGGGPVRPALLPPDAPRGPALQLGAVLRGRG